MKSHIHFSIYFEDVVYDSSLTVLQLFSVEEEVPEDSKEAQHFLQSQLTTTATTSGSGKQCEGMTTETTSLPTSQEPKLG